MTTFTELVESRKEWLNTILRPWCEQAAMRDLRKAADEWTDIAGRIDPEMSIWLWAWGRFPVLVTDGLNGLDETHAVCVTLKNGTRVSGYPDSRESRTGKLWLLRTDGEDSAGKLAGPWTIDDVERVDRV